MVVVGVSDSLGALSETGVGAGTGIKTMAANLFIYPTNTHCRPCARLQVL